MKPKILIAIAALLALPAILIALAQSAPQLINYQGRLTNSAGQPLDGVTVDMTFIFYGAQTGGTAYLSILQPDVLVTAGIYNVLLGSGTINPGTESTLAEVFQKHTDVWMGVKVDAEAEMTPRARIASVPYALAVDQATINSLIQQLDNDGDGHYDPSSSNTPNDDCNDHNPYIYPNAPEICDQLDNQCPGDTGYGTIDENCQPDPGCNDLDGDEYGPGCAPGLDACQYDADNWTRGGCDHCLDNDIDFAYFNCDSYMTMLGPDCNDADPNVWSTCASCNDDDYDSYYELCDNYIWYNGPDCDDLDPNNWQSCSICADNDGDGYFAGCDYYLTIIGPDCDDGNSAVFPFAPEICDLIDNQCPGDPGYSEIDEGCFGTKMVANPGEGVVAIGEYGMDITTVEGHNIAILRGNSLGGDGCQSGGGGDFQCWIKLVNLDPEMAMTNVIINNNDCINCNTAVLDNPDICDGGTCKDVPPAPDVAHTPNDTGYCIVEQGQFFPFNRRPWNVMGCDLQPTPVGQTKPFQVLHPRCGMHSTKYDFGGQADMYTFYATVTAEYLPWNPVGTDGAPGGGDDDARYDFQNYTTVYLMLASFGHKTGYSPLYARGAWKRSNILAGYGSPGNKSGHTVTTPGGGTGTDAYFSVNVAIEYPDRIENQHMGAPGDFDAVDGYEYYGTYAVFFRWDPNVLAPVGTDHFAAGMYSGPRLPCWTQSECDTPGKQNYQHLEIFNPSTMGLIDYANGFIYFYRQIAEDFAYYTSPVNYVTDGGGVIGIPSGNNREGGHHGVAIWDRAYVGGSVPGGSPFTLNGRTQQGPDAEPEQNLLNYHFWVKPGTSGLGSPIKVDTFCGYTGFILGHTGLTFYPSGINEPTDWNAYCSPFSPGYSNPTDQHCDPSLGQSDYAVYHGTENQNSNLFEMGGESVAGTYGGAQNWSVFVCVQ